MSTVTKIKSITIPKNGKEQIVLDYSELKKAAYVLRAINHPLRQEMMELIAKENKINVTKIYVKLRLEQSVASQHLAILRRSAFVKTIRDGKFIHYTINNERIAQVIKLIKDINK